ncbi:hypothetical protein CN977_15185 [Bacillus thuringiensis]|uniref:hypothetical protein n=1 Tax=Bacillus cereus group TaxID=86661 RepID=UPI000BEFEB3C|nr:MULTISPECIES: hypothetical protein [Bacillus cereus group]PEL95788.1 hypothetical protein CN604_24745 [Bacillus wiedmannii]PGO44768.1 hypothetical protein CN977_15185 [Bacillus thuringiensis]
MRHTRNRQLNRKWMNRRWKMPAIKIEDVYNDNALVSSDRLDKTFIWRRKALADGRNTIFFQKNGKLHVVKVKSKN